MISKHFALASIIAGTAVATGAVAELNIEITPTIVTTPNRVAEPVKNSNSAVTVITSEQIATSQANSVIELLSATPGLHISSNGGYGKTSSIFLRGTESDHTLVLVDGLQINSATSGGAAFENIPVEQIDRIEIVRGPRSSLYGSEAIGGVIQIFTKKNYSGGTLKAELGGNKTQQLTGHYGSKSGATNWNIGANLFSTAGVNTLNRAETDQLDDDGYDNRSLNGSLNHQITDDLQVGVSGLYAQGENEFDACFNNTTFATSDDCVSDTVQQKVQLTTKWDATNNWTINLNSGQTRDDNISTTQQTDRSRFITKRNTVNLSNQFTLNEQHRIIAGIDYEKIEIRSTTAYPETEREEKGLYADWQGQFGVVSLGAGVRYDDIQRFGEETTWNAAAGFQLSESLALTLNYGTGYKAPSFNELYFPFFGQPNLAAEESKTGSIGLNGNYANTSWRIDAFNTKIDNLIGFDPDTFLAANTEQTEIDGIEFAANTKFAQLRLELAASYVDARNTQTENLLARRPQKTARLGAHYETAHYSVGLISQAYGRRYNSNSKATRLAGFALLDLVGQVNVTQTITLAGRVENILDKDYSLAQSFGGNDYNNRGLTVYGSIKIKFD